MPMNPGTNVAASEAIRMSHAAASESPAPAHGPLTAAITGFSSARISADVRVVGLLEPVADRARRLLELLQVLAGAEAAARAGDHDGADVRRGSLLERLVQARVQRRVERVEDVGPVQRDREDGAVALGQDFAHRADPIRSACGRESA